MGWGGFLSDVRCLIVVLCDDGMEWRMSKTFKRAAAS